MERLLSGLLLLLLLLGGSQPWPREEEEEEAAAAGAPVRLCGRAFIRAIIFTCGGSRWKRLPSSPSQPQREPPDFVQISSNKGPENNNLLSVLDPMLEQVRSINKPAEQQLPKDLFHLYDDYIESVPASDNLIEYIRQLGDAAHKRGAEIGLVNSKGLNNFPWVKYPRRKRESSATVSEICCRFGCTQTDLSKLC
ncbi:prorelaxin H2-like [Sceloporus undulatus]|uniref:prorelaxin H2-like n=1 Tax=Sceloporus undulatus TaxID=8520 RepID=UPI001C4B3823|nr:prorelaxin H2-like [Sceloporus undulatus]